MKRAMLSIFLVINAVVFVGFQSRAQHVTAVDAVGMTVGDMDRSVAFFSTVLTFEKVSDLEVWGESYEHLEGVFGLRMRVVRMTLGDESITLTQYLAPEGRSFPADSKSNDRWFQHIAIVVSDMDSAYNRLRAFKVQHASSGPQRLPDWNTGAAGIKAFYFRDPDGHFLEIIYFPKGKGDPKWQVSGGRLFLGIDHTAIVVKDTEASLKFYRDVLGLRLAGESENYGTEQEHLNSVFGARLHISGLRAASGPGIEFLEYLSPGDGRTMDIRSNDIVNWQTGLITDDVTRSWTALRASGGRPVSPGPVTLPDRKIGFTNGLLVRDPDGHALLISEK